MQNRLGVRIRAKHFILPKNNHWLKRTVLVFAFIMFDYFSTLVFCRTPLEEANLYARAFMELFGIGTGLTLFVIIVNMPIYIVLTLDSHIINFSIKIAAFVEIFVDFIFAWFIAGLHFNGGVSWFWNINDLTRQTLGAFIYLILAFLFVKPHKPNYEKKPLFSV